MTLREDRWAFARANLGAVAGRRLRTAYGEGGLARCHASFFHAFSLNGALPCEGRGILITMEVCVMNKFVCVMLVAAALLPVSPAWSAHGDAKPNKVRDPGVVLRHVHA